MAKYYTRDGDDGFTGILGGGRVPKYHPRPETVGTLDEATAALGAARALCLSDENKAILTQVQRHLYHLMAEVAATPENAERFRVIDEKHVLWIEEQTDQLGEHISLPNEFILPGDSPSGGLLSLARTIVRRAERRVSELLHSGDLENSHLLRYLNRLSSLCFVLELSENKAYGKTNPTLAKNSHD